MHNNNDTERQERKHTCESISLYSSLCYSIGYLNIGYLNRYIKLKLIGVILKFVF